MKLFIQARLIYHITCLVLGFMLHKAIIAGTGFPELANILQGSTDLSGNNFEIIGFIDDCLSNNSRDLMGFPLLGTFDVLQRYQNDAYVFNSIARDASVKQKSTERLKQLGASFTSCVHKTALVSPTASIGVGSIVGPYVVLEHNSVLSDFVTVNSHSIIAHDSYIGSMSIVNYASVICGSVRIGDHVYIGSNSIIQPGIEVGSCTTIGAASNVNHSIGENQLHCNATAVRLK